MSDSGKRPVTVDSIRAWLKQRNIVFHEEKNSTHFQMNCLICDETRNRLGITKIPNPKKKIEIGGWNCFNCFPDYSLITMSDFTAKKIKDVVVGDCIINSKGVLGTVTHVHNNGIRKNLLNIKAAHGNHIDCTPEHELSVVDSEDVIYGRLAYAKNKGKVRFGKPKFKSANKVKIGDWLVSPKIKTIVKFDSIHFDFSSYVKKTGPQPKDLQEHYLLDRDLGFIFGLYAAEGSYNRGIFYSLNSKEVKLRKKISKIFKKKFGLECKVYDLGKQNVNLTFIGHTYLAKWFDDNLGHLAENKKMINFILNTPEDFRRGFLNGLYAGDGSKKNEYCTSINTISKNLALQGKLVAQSLGYSSGITYKKSYVSELDGLKRRESYLNYICKNKKGSRLVGVYEDVNNFYYRVKSINEIYYGRDVFDLTVTNGHTYTVNGLAVHNCGGNGKKFSSLEYAVEQKKGLKFKTKDEIKKEDLDGDYDTKSGIKPDLHKKFIKVLDKSDCGVREYLIKERKITPEAIEYFQLGAKRMFDTKFGKKNLGDHVAIPYLMGEDCVNLKYRKIKPKDKKDKWQREKGGITALFNDNIIDNYDYDEIIITESEIDAISMWVLGYKNVIGLTAGAKSFKQAWYERLLRFKKIYLLLDNDEAGAEGTKKIAKRIGLDRCYNVVLPDDVKDPNDFLVKYKDKKVMDGLLQKAKQFDVSNVKSLRSALKELYIKRFIAKSDEHEGVSFPYKTMQEKCGSMKAGHLVVIAAKPKTGKTTFALDLTRRLSTGKQKVPCGFYSCEMSIESLAEKFTMQVVPNIGQIENMTKDELLYAQHILRRSKIQMVWPETVDELSPEKICEKIEEITRRYGTKVFVFDNLHFACRSEDEYTAIGKLTQALKLLAVRLGITIVAITHPRKVAGNKKITTDDLKGSSSIFQDADLVIIMNRDVVDPDDLDDEEAGFFSGNMSPETVFDVTSRWTSGGRTSMYFNENRAIFKESGADFDKMLEIKNNKKKRQSKE